MLYCKLIILQIVKQKAPFLLPAEFFYGTLDEITGNIRTFVLPNENETYTFVMDLEHLSSYTSATPQGYTKHYYAGTERVVSKIGCGGLKEITSPIEELEGAFTPIPEKRDMLYGQLDRTVHECLGRESEIIWDNLKYLRELEGLQCEEEQELYFYHPDHLGSTGMVTDNSSNITQGFLYAPFGEIITEFNPSWESGRIPKYSFNAKELDEENGMYYYSARYYAPPTFISRDPMFEKKPFISPYTYCRNNPIILVDPDGRDEYEFTSSGEMKNVEKTDFDSFHKVDENGKRVEGGSLILDKKVVTGQVTLKSDAGTAVNYLKVTGDDEAKQIFEHLANNSVESKTEYGLTRIGDKNGSEGKNMIGANVKHTEGSTAANRTLFDRGYTIREANHNHPNGSNASSDGDVRVAGIIQDKFPKATFYNYTKIHGYTPYDKNTTTNTPFIMLPEFHKKP
ncbi:MAG: RHS repeat-associated core domain-containing protein [Bacteroidales bacterium]|jgi:RHS repeat-associated protein